MFNHNSVKICETAALKKVKENQDVFVKHE